MPIEPITRADFATVQASDPAYYHDCRLDYYEEAIRVSSEVASDLSTVLELGPYRLPLFRGSDTIDMCADLNPTYWRDAGQLPWPVADGHYDLFVALQSFEHLGSVEGEPLVGQYGERQRAVFDEVCRIAGAAVISLPWKWNTPDDHRHNGIDEQTVDDWFGEQPAVSRLIGRRIVMGFKL